MKTLDELKTSYEHGEYDVARPSKPFIPRDKVIDEDKSVKWNKEECERLEIAYAEAKKEWFSKEATKQKQMRKEAADALVQEYGFTVKQAAIAESFVWIESEANPSEYFDLFARYCGFVREMLNTQ